MKKEMNVNGTTQEERGGLSASASNDNDRTQNHADQATESCRNVSADTTFDTTAPRPWTPGPWESVPHLDVYGIYGPSPWAVAYVNFYAVNERGWKPDSLSKHDARLIAAAPDLFEALAALMQDVELFVPARHIPSVEQARAAMDKALGVSE